MSPGALSVGRRALLALCSVSGARGAAAPYARTEQPLMMHLAAGVSSTLCDVCGKNDAGTANCCSEGGAWHGNCGDGAEHTWQAGLDACYGAAAAEALGVAAAQAAEAAAAAAAATAEANAAAVGEERQRVQEAAADQTHPAAGREAEEGNARDASLTCDACGTNGAGAPNCCSSGGAWQGKCGDGAEHSWQAGFDACIGAAQEAPRGQAAPEGGGARDDTASIGCKGNLKPSPSPGPSPSPSPKPKP
jgi:hypothetical protein